MKDGIKNINQPFRLGIVKTGKGMSTFYYQLGMRYQIYKNSNFPKGFIEYPLNGPNTFHIPIFTT